MRVVLVAILLLFIPSRVWAQTDEEIEAAIDRMKAYFYAHQDEATGGWPRESIERTEQRGGETALITLAMLTAGESGQHPKLLRAINYLRQVRMTGTYAVSLRAQVWASLPATYNAQLAADAKWLLNAADEQGRFSYVQKSHGVTNNSTTHYGLLGLWAAARRGIEIPQSYWDRTEKYWLGVQQHDGGWGYGLRVGGDEQMPTYGSMTAAGLNALLVAQQMNHRSRMQPIETLDASIRAGEAWLDERFDGTINPSHNGQTYYYLHAIERVAAANGWRYINDQDWYRQGARHILERQVRGELSPDVGSIEGNPIDTAYALLFLSRARVPVWAAKLQIPGQQWNRRPNDLHYLTRWLSDVREMELNWQVISADRPAEQWLATPVVYLSTNQPLTLTDVQKANLKRYLDLGGTLLAVPEEGGGPVSASIRNLAAELYPQWPMEQLGDDHPVYNALFKLNHGGNQKMYAVSNGARDLIYLAHTDWSFAFQSEVDPGQHNAWRVAANIWTIASDRGLLRGRLEPRFVIAEDRQQTRSVDVLRVLAKSQKFAVEPLAWEQLSNEMLNRTGVQVRVRQGDVADLSQSGVALAHLSGSEVVGLSEAELQAIDAFMVSGGTMLIETVGGRGGFAEAIEKQLAAHYKRGAVPMLGDEPIISGEGLKDGFDNMRVTYRRYAVSAMSLSPRPRLAAFYVNGRPAAIISGEDLTLGMMHVARWGVIGYQPRSATQLMTNLLLAADKARQAAPRTTSSD
jgi:hypothetical protein